VAGRHVAERAARVIDDGDPLHQGVAVVPREGQAPGGSVGADVLHPGGVAGIDDDVGSVEVGDGAHPAGGCGDVDREGPLGSVIVRPAAVLVDAVVQDVYGVGVDSGVVVVAVIAAGHDIAVVAVPVDVGPVCAIAVLVDTVVGDLGGARVHGGIRVVAVVPTEGGVVVAVAVHVRHGADRVAAVAVLVDAVVGDLRGAGVDGRIGVVAVAATVVAAVVAVAIRIEVVHAAAVLVDAVVGHVRGAGEHRGVPVVAVVATAVHVVVTVSVGVPAAVAAGVLGVGRRTQEADLAIELRAVEQQGADEVALDGRREGDQHHPCGARGQLEAGGGGRELRGTRRADHEGQRRGAVSRAVVLEGHGQGLRQARLDLGEEQRVDRRGDLAEALVAVVVDRLVTDVGVAAVVGAVAAVVDLLVGLEVAAGEGEEDAREGEEGQGRRTLHDVAPSDGPASRTGLIWARESDPLGFGPQRARHALGKTPGWQTRLIFQ